MAMHCTINRSEPGFTQYNPNIVLDCSQAFTNSSLCILACQTYLCSSSNSIDDNCCFHASNQEKYQSSKDSVVIAQNVMNVQVKELAKSACLILVNKFTADIALVNQET
ncbi:hypothetical protein RTP6_004508 [Batrachochytrium dendrobatidis]